VKAEGNFDYFEGYDGVFRASWNVAMVECAAIEAMALVTAWPSLRKVSKGHQLASEAAPIVLET